MVSPGKNGTSMLQISDKIGKRKPSARYNNPSYIALFQRYSSLSNLPPYCAILTKLHVKFLRRRIVWGKNTRARSIAYTYYEKSGTPLENYLLCIIGRVSLLLLSFRFLGFLIHSQQEEPCGCSVRMKMRNVASRWNAHVILRKQQ